MRKIREVLRLRLEAGLSIRQISASTKTSVGAIQKLLARADALNLNWPLPEDLDDGRLAALFYPGAGPTTSTRYQVPDWATVHQELKRKGMTKQLLWEEYTAQYPNRCYSYSQYCDRYRHWLKQQKRSMRQTHTGGDKLFVDYAGQTVPVVDADTGEIRQAQVFVAVLGASNYTYACATASQKATDWVASIISALEFIGGVPRLLVPDQPRALMARPDRYEPTAHRLLEELCAHYSLAVMPARPAKPRDKPKVEVAVQVVERERGLARRVREHRHVRQLCQRDRRQRRQLCHGLLCCRMCCGSTCPRQCSSTPSWHNRWAWLETVPTAWQTRSLNMRVACLPALAFQPVWQR